MVLVWWWIGGVGCVAAALIFLKNKNVFSFLKRRGAIQPSASQLLLGEAGKELLEWLQRKEFEKLSVDWRDEELRGVISFLCCCNKVTELRHLLQSDPKWGERAREEVDREGNRAIHLAMKSKSVEIVKSLLEVGVPVDQKNAQGWTALHMACAAGSLEGMELLMANGADVNLQDKGGHTPLIICCANGFSEMSMKLLNEKDISLTPTTFSRQQNCLHFSSLRGNTPICQKILQLCLAQAPQLPFEPLSNNSDNEEEDSEGEYSEAASVIKTVVQQRTVQGWTPFQSSILGGEPLLLEMYLSQFGEFIDINEPKNDGESALHVAVKVLGREIEGVVEGQEGGVAAELERRVERLMKRKEIFVRLLGVEGLKVDQRDCFGKTPLHLAAMGGWVWVVGQLLVSGAGVEVVDFDGLSVLHSVCGSGAKGLKRLAGSFWFENVEEGEEEEETALICLIKLLVRGPSEKNLVGRYLLKNLKKFEPLEVDRLDLCDSTSLHVAAASSDSLTVVKTLLQLGADVTKQNSQGWTPLHLAYSQATSSNKKEGESELVGLIEEHCKKFPELAKWRETSFDVTKEKLITGRVRNLCVTEAERKQVFNGGDTSIDSIVQMIKEKKIKNVVVLAGAGISVSTGIPDYRSKTGIYRNSAVLDSLPSPPSSSSRPISIPTVSPFSPQIFQENPYHFYEVMHKLFLPVYKGKITPSPTHHFLNLLHKKGLLKRIYTQNIDMLELNAGIPESLVVECHGSMRRAYCTNEMCDGRWKFETNIHNLRNPKKTAHEKLKEEEGDFFWRSIEEGGVPNCSKCGSVVRPDIVLFGEPLPPSFAATQHRDFQSCDLLVVMGTTLSVHPFSSLPSRVSLLTPRLLLNLESVGPFQRIEEGDSYRDVQILQKTDESVGQICEMLGWGAHLERLVGVKEEKQKVWD